MKLFDITYSCWIKGTDCIQRGWHFIMFTLPKLPLPSTMRKLKSWMLTVTLVEPDLWTGRQGWMGMEDRATGNGSGSGATTTWGRAGTVTSGWGSWKINGGCLWDEWLDNNQQTYRKHIQPPCFEIQSSRTILHPAGWSEQKNREGACIIYYPIILPEH